MAKTKKFPRFLPLSQKEIVDREFPPITGGIVNEIRPVISQQEFEKTKKEILRQKLP